MRTFVLTAKDSSLPIAIFKKEYLVDVLKELHAYGSAEIDSNNETGEPFADIGFLSYEVLRKYGIQKSNAYCLRRAPAATT